MPRKPTVECLLVPDRGAAQRVRRRLAESGPRAGVIVSTFSRLLERAARRYFVPDTSVSAGALLLALRLQSGAFWSRSLEAAPQETAEAIRRALEALMVASDPHHTVPWKEGTELPGRIGKRIADLAKLARSLKDCLPGSLARIRHLLQTDVRGAAERIRVYRVRGNPALSRWQEALVEKLNSDAAAARDDSLQEMLESCLSAVPRARPSSSLGIIQRALFEEEGRSARPCDGSAQWVRVRDLYQEAEIAAGMAQTLLDANAELQPSDIGLLVPGNDEYRSAVRNALRLTGLAPSGLSQIDRERDLGHEAVYHFLYCQVPHPPAMAQAAVLSSPLMPWSVEQGARMANRVMSGRKQVALPEGCGNRARDIVKRIGLKLKDTSTETGAADGATVVGDAAGLPGREEAAATRNLGNGSHESLVAILQEYSDALAGDRFLASHLARARRAVENLQEEIEKGTSIDWDGLLHMARPQPKFKSARNTEYYMEGVTVWDETALPWRDVKHLIVLGFSESRYPRRLATSPVFTEDEWQLIRRRMELKVDPPSAVLARIRGLFRRQLRAASDTATFMIPYRDHIGTPAPSDSMLFMERLFAREGQSLVVDLDDAERLDRVRFLARAAREKPTKPRAFEVGGGHIRLDRDLRQRWDGSGDQHCESPSSLERLLVSPLAWLLHRLGALPPAAWAPDSASAMVQGDLAHRVFASVFKSWQEQRSEVQLAKEADASFKAIVRAHAPFLGDEQWRIEHRSLQRMICKAARAWQDVLLRLGASGPQTEQYLQGEWLGIPVRGWADLIVKVRGGRRLIVDYKLSNSGQRQKRMVRGHELQAGVYRAMAQDMDRSSGVDIVYFTMRDAVCLTDSKDREFADVPQWHRVNTDSAGVSRLAAARIRELQLLLREGSIRLNSKGDREWLDKECGITPHALDSSPLIELFMVQGEEQA